MIDSLLNWLTQYGYVGLFALLILGIVGLPVPDETLLVFSGYLVSRGRLNPALTFIAGFFGTVCGISVSYSIGRTLGHTAVLRFGKYIRLTPRRMDLVHHWFQKSGEWLLAIGYFIPGVRHFTALVAGASKLEFRTFAVFAWSGAAVWVTLFLSLGYFVGENWRRAVSLVQRYTVAAVVLGVTVLVIGCWLHSRFKKSERV